MRELRKFSILRFLGRLWALGHKPENNNTEAPCISPPKPSLSVFIDIENVGNADVIRNVFEELKKRWNCVLRRAYGSGLAGYRELFRELGISPVEVFANIRGKNAADIALVVDLMTELGHGQCDGYAIISGDSDFSVVVTAIRERGFRSVVYGPETTPVALRSFSTEFHLLPVERSETFMPSASTPMITPRILPVGNSGSAEEPTDLVNLAYELMANSGKTTLRAINEAALRRNPSFSAKQYGNRKLLTVLRRTGLLQIGAMRNSHGAVYEYEVRPKSADLTESIAVDRHRASVVPLISRTAVKQTVTDSAGRLPQTILDPIVSAK